MQIHHALVVLWCGSCHDILQFQSSFSTEFLLSKSNFWNVVYVLWIIGKILRYFIEHELQNIHYYNIRFRSSNFRVIKKIFNLLCVLHKLLQTNIQFVCPTLVQKINYSCGQDDDDNDAIDKVHLEPLYMINRCFQLIIMINFRFQAYSIMTAA